MVAEQVVGRVGNIGTGSGCKHMRSSSLVVKVGCATSDTVKLAVTTSAEELKQLPREPLTTREQSSQ